MNIAIFVSQNTEICLENYLPANTTCLFCSEKTDAQLAAWQVWKSCKIPFYVVLEGETAAENRRAILSRADLCLLFCRGADIDVQLALHAAQEMRVPYRFFCV